MSFSNLGEMKKANSSQGRKELWNDQKKIVIFTSVIFTNFIQDSSQEGSLHKKCVSEK